MAVTSVVFACKSNSCRSQMAEGWAKQWIKTQREHLQRIEENLDLTAKGKNNIVLPTPTGCSSWSYEQIERRKMTLDGILIASVALDSSSVFRSTSSSACDACTRSTATSTSVTYTAARGKCDVKVPVDDMSYDDMCGVNDQRKCVKEKAVRAMALDGIDISSFRPKTVDELLPSLHATKNTLWGRIYSALPFPSSNWSVMEIGPNSAGSTLHDGCVVDKLVVLCSCGDEVKRRLVRQSRDVVQWDVDAPTAAAKAGEGDNAYRRVSLEIRGEVEALMEGLVRRDSVECWTEKVEVAL